MNKPFLFILETPGRSSPVLDHTIAEMGHFIAQAGGAVVPDGTAGAWRVCLRTQAEGLPPFAFAVRHADGETLLLGHDDACVLHAAYTFLEQLGWQFEITGPVLPQGPQFDALCPGREERIEPKVQRRGIRQHINFPMDISSYPLEEAKEYLRNLARLRFNHITFHSYHNHFVAGPQTGTLEEAGHFFYGQRHDLPDHAVLRRVIRNQKTFCIPEIEPVFDDTAERSRRAVAWLRDLMGEAKRIGLTVQFSFEPRDTAVDVAKSLVTARNLLRDYPQIDVLEVMSEETGYGGAPITLEQLREWENTQFGFRVISGEVEPHVLQGNALKVLGQVGHNIRVANALLAELRAGSGKGSIPGVAVGVYCVQPKYLQGSLRAMERLLSPEITFALLPGHGSARMTRYLDEADGPSRSARDRTLLYGWIELDGSMYVQQSAVDEIRHMVADALDRLDGQPAYGMCFHHWRTAENRLSARYAALATLFGAIHPPRFYHEYANRLGIHSPGDFSAVMSKFNIGAQLVDEHLGMCGFCFAPCWQLQRDHQIIARIRGIMDGECLFELRKYSLKYTTNPAGREFLEFFANRVETTLIFMRGLEIGTRIQAIIESRRPEDLTVAERAEVCGLCDEVLAVFEEFIRKFAEQMPDRGCEGTLISFWHVSIYCLRVIRKNYGGEAVGDDLKPPTSSAGDAPPPLAKSRTN